MADGSPYVDRYKATASYRPKGYGISPGLQRARRPFLLSNIITGSVISLFVVGIWAYSIRAVRQDVFDDVDEEAKALTQEKKKQVETVEERAKKVEEKLKAIANERIAKTAANLKGIKPQPLSESRGVLPVLGRSEVGWYDPTKTFVWGAPSVDNMGRIGDQTSND